MPPRDTVLRQIEGASRGFEALLDNDLVQAKQILSSDPDSAFHLVGLGLSAFLAAILSREDDELRNAQETLIRAETMANDEANAKRAKGETAGIFPGGTEYKLLTGDATIGQALIAIMSESYVEFVKAIWKMNKSYKIFMGIFKTVFPEDVSENDSLHDIFTRLNDRYLEQRTKPQPAVESSGGFFSSWGRKKPSAVAAPHLRHFSSSSAIPTVSSSSSNGEAAIPASAPVSELPSRSASSTDLSTYFTNKVTLADSAGDAEVDSYPTPLWADDPLTKLVISGAALGSGMFGLIFSMLPPKMRKMISWFGFSNSNRPVALKLLTIAASTGDDVHGYFASLTLVTFYGFILLMSGWQASESTYLRSLSSILGRVHDRFPNGTLWVLNRAKLARYERRSEDAVGIIVEALGREAQEGNSFREADSLLVFELSWLYLSQARFIETADAMERMCTLNSWSHATYIAIAAGALVDEINDQRRRGETPSLEVVDRAEKLLAKLPGLCGLKRVFGEKPVTEVFILRRLEAQKAKVERWIRAGRLKEGAKLWEVVRISNASELGLFWATIGGRSPACGIQKQIDLLSSFSPPPRFGPASSAPPVTPSSTISDPLGRTETRSSTLSSSHSRRRVPLASTSSSAPIPTPSSAIDDLDTTAEVLQRDLLLGVLYTALGHYDSSHYASAIGYLDAVLNASPAEVGDEKWVVPFAGWHRAVVELKTGDAETQGMEDAKAKEVWRRKMDKAQAWLDQVLAVGEYDMKTRLESRVLMLRDEIRMKKVKVGLA
ncbi:mitochondrial outer membrane protein IML2 [Rhodotorula toruloides]|uniref:Mitochondrial outer membrane protein IML2 n=1 Tax=Rhodotorula toruloides TaxID=5286 RepID=A0A511KHG1_RHOTO|nr:mitochondrial outer membrane protein IML2 [Rhodotorula toruloides]